MSCISSRFVCMMTKLVYVIVTLFNHVPHQCFCDHAKVEPVPLPVQHTQMRPLGPRVICTLQIDTLSKAFSRLITRPALLAFPALQKHNIHQSASTRRDEANKRHTDRTGVVRYSNNSPREVMTQIPSLPRQRSLQAVLWYLQSANSDLN